MCEINTKPDRHTCEDYKNPVVACATAAYVSWKKKSITHLSSYLFLSLSPTFSNFQTLTFFMVWTDNSLQPPNAKATQSAYVWHHIDEHSQFHIASFFSTGSCTHRCDLVDMKALFSWCSRALLLSYFASPPVWSSLPHHGTLIFSLLSISFCCYHPCLFLSFKSSLLAPMGRISQSLLLRSFFYLFLALSVLSVPLTQAVSKGRPIYHHCVHTAPKWMMPLN